MEKIYCTKCNGIAVGVPRKKKTYKLRPAPFVGLYNGNIAESYWRTASDNTQRKYSYAYDHLSRFLQASYQKPQTTLHIPGSYDEQVSYDKNGNITHLERTGEYDDMSYNLQIDDLTYTYSTTNPNQLAKVDDATNNPNGFKDGTNISSVDDYLYDAYGNMTVDHNKGIAEIKYNHLNLPTKITFATTGSIEYLYNAGGVKVRKIVTEGSAVRTTDYLNGFQYINNNMEFFPHAEGYVKNTMGSYNYVFNYTDHLGNIRLSYTKNPTTNVLTILEENNYYPFGLKHRNYNMTKKQYEKLESTGGIVITPTNETVYDYKYNGKELQDELGLNFYDYGARNYDPAIGRWMNMDALSEMYYPISPYTYALNNPTYFVDPDGNYIEIYYGKDSKEHVRYEYQKDRDYSKIDSPFLADAYRALDALYNASTIDIDGEQVNVMQTLMDSSKELSVAQGDTEKSSTFSSGKNYRNRNETSSQFYNDIGTIYFNNKQGTLYDDVNDTPSDVLLDLLSKNKLPKTAKVNSPTSELGHEMIHAFNFLTSKNNAFRNRMRSGPVEFGPIKFKNQEEAKATTLSRQINIQLGEHPRNNHRGAGVNTKGVLSTEIIKP